MLRFLYSALCLFLLALLLGVMPACNKQNPASADTRTTDERAIRELDAELLEAGAAKNLERVLSAYADDASFFPPNAPIASGKEAIRAVWEKMFATSGIVVTWRTTKVEASRSGDLGYLEGSYEITTKNAKGKSMTDRGKWVSVVKKVPGGDWKVIADIFNSSLPLPTFAQP